MNIGLHQFAERSVNASVSRKQGLSGERRADDAHAEVATPVTRTGMPGVFVTLVLDFEFARDEFALQTPADNFYAVTHGNTLRNGRTLTSR
jgi:hypothetical protein